VARDEGYDAAHKLILTSPHFSTHNCLPIEQLNKVYNAVDIGVNTCIGEGWGLVNTEHAATGTVQVVPDHTSLKEIFNDIPRAACNGAETDRNYGLERLLPDPDSMADLLDYYYRDRDALKIDGEWCRSRINEKQFTWPVITKKMLRIVDAVLSAKEEEPKFKGFGTPAKIV
jgi:glycosyltransferase involved in cell wall biosynthesis